jgi:RHS repeat-associated protein
MYAGEQFDPELGLYYNRARYLDVQHGRFWGMDPEEGSGSLHRYLYADANPVNAWDPSGRITDYTPYGEPVHQAISDWYFAYHMFNDVSYGSPVPLGANPNLQPDIFDFTERAYMEIKPLSDGGISSAYIQMRNYADNYRSLGYTPNIEWEVPGRTVFVLNRIFYVKNASGVLFYTADASDRDLRNVNTDASRLLNRLRTRELQGDLFALGIGIVITSWYISAMSAQLSTSIALATQNAAMGKVA